MDEQSILEKSLASAIVVSKKMHKNQNKKDYKADDIGMHDLYYESVEMAEHISYHAVKGVFPKKLFEHRSPNETEKESKYIEKNYKQLTLPVFIDYLSTITRPFGDGNWAIEYTEDSSDAKTSGKTFQRYVEKEMPIYGSLENFIKFILPSIKSIDSNGFLAVRPYEIKYILNDDDEQVIDPSEPYSPTIYYFHSKDVIDYNEDYYLFLSKETSIVTYGGKEQKTGNVFELYTKDAVFFIIQTGEKTKDIYEIQEYYRHDLGYIPVSQLKGIPNLSGDKILWQSPFLYSVDLLDLVATNGNWLQAMINSSVFPVKVMFGSPCEFRDSKGNICQEGKITDHEMTQKTCPQCNGIGLKSRISPLGTLLLNPSTKFSSGEQTSNQDPLKYVSPEVHTLEFIDKKIQSDELKARGILHLRNKNSSSKTKDEKTATEVFDDAKSMTAFVKPISDQIFDTYEWACKVIGQQRYGKLFKEPNISYPKTFDFKNPEDYLQDVTNAIDNNLPPSFIQTILMQYISSFYGDNAKSTEIFKLIMLSDRLFGIANDEINMQLARGTVAKWESILHTSILIFINDAITKDDNFMSKPIEQQVTILQETAKLKASEISDSTKIDIYAQPN